MSTGVASIDLHLSVLFDCIDVLSLLLLLSLPPPPLYHPLCSRSVCVTAAWSTEARCLTSDSLQFKVKPPFHLVFSSVTIGRWLCSEKLTQFVYFWSILYNWLFVLLCQFFVCSYFATTLPTALRAFEILLAVDRFSNFYKLLTASAAFTSSSQLWQMLVAVDSFGCF